MSDRHEKWVRVEPGTADRFWQMVDGVADTEDCWEWQAARDLNGYGRFSLNGRLVPAHRFAYEDAVGPIPDGLVIDHLCRNKACVNPDHLEPVTQGENVRRGVGPSAVNAAKTHCIHGHEFTPENTKIHTAGMRRCRECAKKSSRESKRRTRAAAKGASDGQA